jgi:hypothetical protein
MYYRMVSECTRTLKSIELWLDRAEQHAAAKYFDARILMASRLAPDMQPFIYQVQSTHPTGAAGNLRHRRFGDQAATVAAIWRSAS